MKHREPARRQRLRHEKRDYTGTVATLSSPAATGVLGEENSSGQDGHKGKTFISKKFSSSSLKWEWIVATASSCIPSMEWPL